MFFTRKTRDLIVRGVPEALRGELWMLFSGIYSTDFTLAASFILRDGSVISWRRRAGLRVLCFFSMNH